MTSDQHPNSLKTSAGMRGVRTCAQIKNPSINKGGRAGRTNGQTNRRTDRQVAKAYYNIDTELFIHIDIISTYMVNAKTKTEYNPFYMRSFEITHCKI